SLESSETSTEEILAVKMALHQCPHCGFVESLPELDVEEVGFNGRLQWCCQDTSQKSQYRHKSERHAANV
ncbi:MAG: hypothetical protein V7735_25625, partial [Photobacterium frigidiphilum]|uniref:hypothetical protein n=1 Tax=Photobacterium frigidiphilum TaxID=264736 RepID=UPI0030026CE3